MCSNELLANNDHTSGTSSYLSKWSGCCFRSCSNRNSSSSSMVATWQVLNWTIIYIVSDMLSWTSLKFLQDIFRTVRDNNLRDRCVFSCFSNVSTAPKSGRHNFESVSFYFKASVHLNYRKKQIFLQ